MPTVFASVSVTFLLLYLATLALAYGHRLAPGMHMLWGFFMAASLILLQCLVFGFFIGSGKTIRRVVEEKGLSHDWIRKTRDYKNRSYPPMLAAILVSAAAAVSGGGVSTGAWPLWTHQALVWAALALNAYSLWISRGVLAENVEAIHRINREVARQPDAVPPPVGPSVGKEGEDVPPAPGPGPSSRLFFLAAALWVPYLYMKFSLGSWTFPWRPFAALSGLFLLAGWRQSRKDKAP